MSNFSFCLDVFKGHLLQRRHKAFVSGKGLSPCDSYSLTRKTTAVSLYESLYIPDQLIVRALYDFDAINEDDLSFRKGDKLEVDEETRQGSNININPFPHTTNLQQTTLRSPKQNNGMSL